MHNIKLIRENSDEFKKLIKSRNVDVNVNEIIELDKKNRNIIQKKEKLEKEKKDISKSQDKSNFSKSKELSNEINNLTNEHKEVKNKLNIILSTLPNLPLKDVPIGKDDTFNKEISKSGEIKKFKFKPKSHYEIGEKLKMLDFDTATKTTGSRFVFVKGQLASLERAISNFMLDVQVKKKWLYRNFSTINGLR